MGNDRSGTAKAFILPGRTENGEPAVRGFYTLSMAQIGSAQAATSFRSRLPRYPLPVALIGRLAVHEGVRGRRLGEQLLVDALGRVLALADQIGCLGVIVDAKDPSAEQFYEKYGFAVVEAIDPPRRMFLPLATVRADLS